MSSDPFPLIQNPAGAEATTASLRGSDDHGEPSSPGSPRAPLKTKTKPERRRGRKNTRAKAKGTRSVEGGTFGAADRSKLRAEGQRPGDKVPRRLRRASVTSTVEIYRIDPLVALRISAAFFFCIYLMLVVATATLVIGGLVTGLTSGFTDFLADIGWDNVQVNLAQLAVGVALAGSIFVIACSLLSAFLVVFYNLISEVVGGVRVVLSDETVPSDENVVEANVG